MRLRGFYGVVDEPGSLAEGRALAEALIAGGACAVQVRVKRGPARRFLELARAVREVVGEVPLIVNDRLDVAVLARAAGVHVGQDDLPLAAVRAAAPGLVVGVSTHDPAQAAAAARAGADYVGFGPVFPTTTKENPDPVQGIAGLAEAVRAAGAVPVVAIGGISVEAAAEVARTGAAAACAISGVNRAADVVAAARAIAAEF